MLRNMTTCPVLKTNKNKIVITTIVPRGDACNTKVEKVNSLLKEFCESNGIDMIFHDNINAKVSFLLACIIII